MRSQEHTIGEQLFETYLESQDIKDFEYEKEHEGKTRHPDYSVQLGAAEYIFDVKEFDPPRHVIVGQPVFYDPLPAIREKINQASRQFREFKDQPCCLVLYNNGDPYVHLEDASDMLGAMYGDPGIAIDFNLETGQGEPDTARPIFGERGKMIRPRWSKPQNTTISAIITLRHVRVGVQRLRKHMREVSESNSAAQSGMPAAELPFDKEESQLGVVVFENVFARVPLPRDVFCGSYDERYGAEGEMVLRVFAGKEVLAFERVEQELDRQRKGL